MQIIDLIKSSPLLASSIIIFVSLSRFQKYHNRRDTSIINHFHNFLFMGLILLSGNQHTFSHGMSCYSSSVNVGKKQSHDQTLCTVGLICLHSQSEGIILTCNDFVGKFKNIIGHQKKALVLICIESMINGEHAKTAISTLSSTC